MFPKGSLVLLLGLLVISPALGRIVSWRGVDPGTAISNAIDEVDEDNSSDGSADDVGADSDVDGNDVARALDDEESSEEPNDDENEIEPQTEHRLSFACRFNLLMLDPTCASDGNTYANRFELACAQRKDSSITEVECDDSNPYRRRVFTIPSDD